MGRSCGAGSGSLCCPSSVCPVWTVLILQDVIVQSLWPEHFNEIRLKLTVADYFLVITAVNERRCSPKPSLEKRERQVASEPQWMFVRSLLLSSLWDFLFVRRHARCDTIMFQKCSVVCVHFPKQAWNQGSHLVRPGKWTTESGSVLVLTHFLLTDQPQRTNRMTSNLHLWKLVYNSAWLQGSDLPGSGCSWVMLDTGWNHSSASAGPFVLSQVCFLIVVSRATVDFSSHHLHQHIVTFGADEILYRLLIFWLIFRKGILWLKAAYSCWMLQDLYSHHVSTLPPRICSTKFSSAPLT